MASIQQRVSVLWNKPVNSSCFRMGLSCPAGFAEAQAGQFVMLHLGERQTALLRRPFSIFGLIGNPGDIVGIELLYKVVGQGTTRMSQLKKKDRLDLLGPLGHGFKVNAEGPFYLVAGGIGVAPIHFLAHQLRARQVDLERCRVFIGAQSKADVLCRKAFADLGLAVTVTTDDGSAGDQCLVTDPLEAAVMEKKPAQIFACGPPGMLSCVAGIVSRHQVACQVSVESLMACGLGACLGCAVPSRQPADGYRHVCIDGPVFDSADLDWAALG